MQKLNNNDNNNNILQKSAVSTLEGNVNSKINRTPFTIVGLLPLWLYTLRPHVSCITKITIPFDRIAYSMLGLLAIVGDGLVFNVRRSQWARITITASNVQMIGGLEF